MSQECRVENQWKSMLHIKHKPQTRNNNTICVLYFQVIQVLPGNSFFSEGINMLEMFFLLRVSKNHIGNHWKHGRNHKI